jgi:hypothetical protein
VIATERSTSTKILIVLLTALLGVFLVGVAADAHFPGRACENETPQAQNKHCAEGHGGEDPGQCSDGLDNDGDGLVDGDDPDCGTPPPPPPPPPDDRPDIPQCSDGRDNDGDGLTDFPDDPGCSSAEDNTEDDRPRGEPPVDSCNDGEDNDGDGATDADDTECQDPEDGVEDGSDIPPDTCSDGEDNDGDGVTDADDPECQDPEDGVEDGSDVGAAPTCGDPDGDGVDHSAFDNTADETGPLSSIVHEVDQALPTPVGGDQGVVTEVNCALVAGVLGL